MAHVGIVLPVCAELAWLIKTMIRLFYAMAVIMGTTSIACSHHALPYQMGNGSAENVIVEFSVSREPGGHTSICKRHPKREPWMENWSAVRLWTNLVGWICFLMQLKLWITKRIWLQWSWKANWAEKNTLFRRKTRKFMLVHYCIIRPTDIFATG